MLFFSVFSKLFIHIGNFSLSFFVLVYLSLFLFHIYLTITFLTESVRQTFKKNCSEYLSEKVGQTLSRVSRLKAKENKTGF